MLLPIFSRAVVIRIYMLFMAIIAALSLLLPSKFPATKGPFIDVCLMLIDAVPFASAFSNSTHHPFAYSVALSLAAFLSPIAAVLMMLAKIPPQDKKQLLTRDVNPGIVGLERPSVLTRFALFCMTFVIFASPYFFTHVGEGTNAFRGINSAINAYRLMFIIFVESCFLAYSSSGFYVILCILRILTVKGK